VQGFVPRTPWCVMASVRELAELTKLPRERQGRRIRPFGEVRQFMRARYLAAPGLYISPDLRSEIPGGAANASLMGAALRPEVIALN
jgi:hypothetical protein